MERRQLNAGGWFLAMATHFFPWDPITDSMVGQHVSIVVMTGERKHVVWGSNQLLSAKIQARGDQLVALHCLKVDEVTDASSIVVPIPPPEAADFCRVSEVCSGIGGTLHGAVSCGMKP